MSNTPTWKLADVTEGSASAEVDYNHNLRWLEAIAAAVAEDETNNEPGAPDEGDVHLVGPAPSLTWFGEDHEQEREAEHGDIALWINGAWEFRKAPEGYAIYDKDAAALKRWSGTAWV